MYRSLLPDKYCKPNCNLRSLSQDEHSELNCFGNFYDKINFLDQIVSQNEHSDVILLETFIVR